MIPHHWLTTEVTDPAGVPHPFGFEGCAASHEAPRRTAATAPSTCFAYGGTEAGGDIH
jgi:hypothetical protein